MSTTSVTTHTPRLDPELPADDTLTACLRGAWERPCDWVSLSVVADRLEELGADSRAAWVRAACDLWREAEVLQPGPECWSQEDCRDALLTCGVERATKAWRAAGLWGVLVGAFAPAGDGSGRRMYHTWVNTQTRESSHWLWLWACGLADSGQAYEVCYAADRAAQHHYATATELRGDNAGTAAAHRHYAASRQATAVRRQAAAVTQPGDAGMHIAAAIAELAYAAWHQADAAAYQASLQPSSGNEARQQVFKYARCLWQRVWKLCQHLESI